MTTLEQIQSLIPEMTPGEKSQVFQQLAQELNGDFPGINSMPGVAGGDPCIGHTRIPVWSIIQMRKLGGSDSDILNAYPGLSAKDLVNATDYYETHREEIERQIIENETA